MEFEFPDVLPTTADGLTELAEQVEAEIGVFQARHKRGDKLTNDELDTFELRIAQRGQVADAINDLADADAESAERAAALMDSLNPADPEPEADPEVEAEVEPEAEPVAEVEQPEPVAAAARQAATFGATALSNVDPNEAARPGGPQGQAVFTLQPTAPNYAKYNGPVDTRVLAEAIANDKGEFTGLRTDGPTVLATMERPWDGVVVSDFDTFVAELDRVANEIIGHGAVTASGLIAAGGWCSPSEPSWAFDPTQPAQGLLSYPEIRLKRGGIIVNDEPDFSALQAAGRFHFTESQLEATTGNPPEPVARKPIVEIPCVSDTTEYRLEAIGWGVKAGILQRRAWPELIKKFLDEFMVAHQQRVSRLTLDKVLALSPTQVTIPTDAVLGATTSASLPAEYTLPSPRVSMTGGVISPRARRP